MLSWRRTAEPRGWSRKADRVLGRAGGPCRGRCKSPSGARPSRWRLCVQALAKQCFASKAPSPCKLDGAIHGANALHGPPARPLTVSVGVQPRKKEKKSKSGSLRCACSGDDQRSSPTKQTRVDQGRHPPTAVQYAVPADRGNLSKAGWLRLRGRERHGWRDRGWTCAVPAT